MVGQRDWNFSRGGVDSMNLSFAGCGFLGIYHVGVASCLREYAPHLVADKISGTSAGALAACALMCGCCLGECTSFTLRLATKARERTLGPLHPSFNLVRYLREGLHDFLPENAHEIVSGRLYISITRVSDRKNILVSEFDSKDDLIDALICTAFVPFYCGVLPPKFKGVRYVDGCLSDNNPILDDNTVVVSPFAGESDICPKDNSANFLSCTLANTNIQFTLGNLYRMSRVLFPPHPEILSKMCQEGFEDCLRFLQRNNLISCTRHLAIQSSIVTSKPLHLDDLEADYIDYDSESTDTEDSSSICDDEDCADCKHRRHVALIKNLPPSVLTALQAACDSVNKGVFGSLYNLRAYKVLSLLVAPWFLPMDMMVLLGQRLYEWAPYMPGDMQWFIKEFILLLKDMVHYIQKGRHRYSARLSCQLAITEEDFLSQRGHISPRHSPSPSHSRTSSFSKRRMNVGFSVDFKSHSLSPLKCVGDLSRQVLDKSSSGTVVVNMDSSDEKEMKSSGPQDKNEENHHHHQHSHHHHHGVPHHHHLPSHLQRHQEGSRTSSRRSSGDFHQSGFHNHPHHHHMNANYDTFEHCLHVTNQIDSVIAFYYTEEDNPNVMKITEIFALDDPNGPKPDFNPSDLAWDSYVKLHSTSSGSPSYVSGNDLSPEDLSGCEELTNISVQ